MLSQQGAFSGVAGCFHTVGQGQCRDYLNAVLMVLVGGGSTVSSGGFALTSGWRAVEKVSARGMVGVPARGVAGSVPAAGMVVPGPRSALSLGQSVREIWLCCHGTGNGVFCFFGVEQCKGSGYCSYSTPCHKPVTCVGGGSSYICCTCRRLWGHLDG